jgi:hypothetical protein
VRKDLDAAGALAESTLSGPSTYLEKPVTAEILVKTVAGLLNVELNETAETPELSEETLRQRLLDLLKGADPDTLKKALKVLQEDKSG